jgi:hypothetical protein
LTEVDELSDLVIELSDELDAVRARGRGIAAVDIDQMNH